MCSIGTTILPLSFLVGFLIPLVLSHLAMYSSKSFADLRQNSHHLRVAHPVPPTPYKKTPITNVKGCSTIYCRMGTPPKNCKETRVRITASVAEIPLWVSVNQTKIMLEKTNRAQNQIVPAAKTVPIC